MITILYDNQLDCYNVTVLNNDNTGGFFQVPVLSLLNFLAFNGYTVIYCFEGAKLFADLDCWGLHQGLKQYKDLYPSFKKARVSEECMDSCDGDQTYYTRTYWVAAKKHNSRHKRLIKIKIINASNYFGGQPLNTLLSTFQVDNLSELLIRFNRYIYKLTGLMLIDEKSCKPNFLTLGSLAKAFYLKIKYPHIPYNNRLITYQNEFPASKIIETELRVKGLLTSGIIYLKDKTTHYNLFKYDKISLFPFIEKMIGGLSMPVEIDCNNPSNFITPPGYEDIYIFKSLVMSKKPGMPALFPDPEGYTGENKKIVDINDIAIFKNLYKEYEHFYNIIDMDIAKIYRCKKIEDVAIIEYVDRLFTIKNSTDDNILYFLVKLILNNLHGKFAQNPIVPIYKQIETDNGIYKKVDKLKDKWELSHFDFIRGAYIYSMARAHMLKEIRYLSKYVNNIEAHLYYSDTDSLVLDFELPSELIGRDIGLFKCEGYIEKFKAYAPKIYAHINKSTNERILKCAGAPSREILNYYYEFSKNQDLIDFLNNTPYLPITTLHRSNMGAKYIREWRPLTAYGEYREAEGEL